MALPASGVISLNQVNVELKKSATAAISMNDAAVRALAKVASGAISMSNLHGKSSEVVFINTVARTEATIHTLMGSPTVATNYIFENTATISAASVGGWALQTGTFPAGSTLRIINKGAIRGGGGKGGNANTALTNGSAGGTALVLNFPVTIDNTGGTIWGGGGGGGGGGLSGGGGGGAGIPAGGGGGSAGPANTGKAGSATEGGAGGLTGGTIKGGNGGAPGAAGAGGGGNAKPTGGGRGGYSVQANGNAVTWIAVGDRKGDVV